MAVAPVAGRRLDRVADGVAEVEHVAQAGVALVGGDDLALVAGAGEDDVVELGRSRAPRSPRTRSQSAPPASRPVFSTSTKPAASSSGGSVASVAVSASTAAGRW